MRPFRFTNATEEVDALKACAETGSPRYVAGGTGLLDLMKLHVETPDHLVDVQNLPLEKIEKDGTKIWVGAAVKNSDMAANPLIEKNFPLVSKALLSGASPQLRNAATLGGNLLQRTRCSYFRDTAWACNKRKPGSGCPALEGQNRMNAILGGSHHCIATHASDLCVALSALEARVKVRGGGGERWVEFADFHRLPGDSPHIETCLQPGELVLGAEIPVSDWFRHSTYVKVRDRASYAFALASAAVALQVEGGIVQNARVAFGGLGTVPWRAREAETFLTGQKPSERMARAAARIALTGSLPRKHNSFKVALAEETLVRAVLELGRPA
ncbi:MAG: FAD binding domain-containing protein [Bdellovibrionota bacterium]